MPRSTIYHTKLIKNLREDPLDAVFYVWAAAEENGVGGLFKALRNVFEAWIGW